MISIIPACLVIRSTSDTKSAVFAGDAKGYQGDHEAHLIFTFTLVIPAAQCESWYMRPADHGRFSPDLRPDRAIGRQPACLDRPGGQAFCQETLEHGAASGTTMTTTQASHAAPVDSLEARWILPGAPGSGVREWFGRFPTGTETREDIYLVFPPLDGLSMKLRAGRTLEVKCYLGTPGVLGLPERGVGRLESWRKWSFADDILRPTFRPASAWVTVRKFRRTIWFPLPARQTQVPEQSPARTGCKAELTEADVSGRPIWTVGLEATGSAECLPKAIQHAVRRLFASPLPSEAGFHLENSWSYMQWLYRQPYPAG
jgi:hypothetical protein